jgi:hypothetical protein
LFLNVLEFELVLALGLSYCILLVLAMVLGLEMVLVPALGILLRIGRLGCCQR